MLSSCGSVQQPQVIYKTKVVYKCDLPKLPNPPKPPKVNLYKVENQNKIYYCYDSDSATEVAKYLTVLLEYVKTCHLITQQGVSNGTDRFSR